MPDEPAIELDAVTRRFGARVALDRCTLAVARGSIHGYVGPNGAGKTTTLRILATLLRPDAGTARVLGLDVRGASHAVRRAIGYMPDTFGAYPGMTAAEYLDFFAAAYRIGRRRRRDLVADVLELTDLAGAADLMVDELSRGNRQRLALARTLVHDPAVLLLDEPASGLDPAARIELRELLRALRGMGKTILISSHILAELRDMCDRVAVLVAGRVIADGRVEELLDRVRPHCALDLEFVREGDAEAARRLLRERAGAPLQALERVGRRLELTADWPEKEVAAVVAELARAGLGLLWCRPREATLEEFFLRTVTAEAPAADPGGGA